MDKDILVSPTPAPALAVPTMASVPGRHLSPIKTTTNIYDFRSSDLNLLSPPITPVKRPNINMDTPPSTQTAGLALLPTPRSSLEARPALTWSTTVPKAYAGKYNIGAQIGAGAWSNVSVAEEIIDKSPHDILVGGLTPPPSPNMGSRGAVFAVKAPNQKAARRVLAREARVLTFLSADPMSHDFIVGFHGQKTESATLVLEFLPQTLSKFVAERCKALQFSTSTMFEPVVGEMVWKDLARRLISGLDWMHSRGVAHGDIKADNILMRRRAADVNSIDMPSTTAAPFVPVFCDFSSALVDSESASDRDDADDAVTTTYASPELLDSFRFVTRTFAKPVDRKKADVWATAVALVLAAVGTEPYAEAKLAMQRTAMAKHGDVLGSVRGGVQATRIMKGGYVALTVKEGLAIRPEDRTSAAKWLGKLPF